MTRAFLTGGTGCIGSNLAAALVRRGVQVRMFRRAGSDLRALKGIDVTYVPGDVRDYSSLLPAMSGCDIVFHTAAVVSFAAHKRQLQTEVNAGGTRNVVTACLKAGVARLVHTSSVATIGPAASGEPATEETSYGWGTEPGYKYSKYLAEQEVLRGVKDGLSAVMVNPSVVIGERDLHRHGSAFILALKRGLTPFYVDGGMNVAYVGDVVRGMIAAAERGRSGERYILGGHDMTHRAIFTRTAELVGGRKPISRVPIPLLTCIAGMVEAGSSLIGLEPMITVDLARQAGLFLYYSSAKAERELGYSITPFDDAVLAAYRWYVEEGLV